ncbi:MAG: fused MFS/spermidine synthase [Anaerolineales bacterium]
MAYFAICIFLSAFLLFQVQPMIGRYILPWFGGTPAVWSTVMLFFQVLLTGGYAYANWLIRPGRRREVVHLVLLGISAALMIGLGLTWKSPITPSAAWKPAVNVFPVWEIFKLLVISVGLPYFLLSSNSPLMQAWFHRRFPARTAYRLYALSNLGSFLALVSYPVLIEPRLRLSEQGWMWSLLYLVYAGLAGYGALRALRGEQAAGAEERPAASAEAAPRPAGRLYLLWILLAATASILLLAVTSHITQEVAVIPFLWVLPLTIYLLTFILAFSGEGWYARQWFLVLMFVATLLYGWALVSVETLSILVQIAIYSFILFVGCMVCHGELYRLRPHPAHLTSFYLMVSIGGALGGIFINFAAPFIFEGYWEMPLGFLLCWLLFLAVMVMRPEPIRWRAVFLLNQVLVFSAILIAGALAFQYIRADLKGSLYAERNFYGVVRVRPEAEQEGGLPDRIILIHGITIHGAQFLDPQRRDQPTMYFSETSGAGVALRNYPRPERGLRVGVLGLGIGTLAAYGQPGDVFRFYEINPAVISLAEGQGGYFTFLQDSPAAIEIVPGDARLSLEAELAGGGSQEYDLLILDVFSSDSIPVHLLDVEAFELYLRHLQPEGMLLVHISNRHLDLVPVVWTLADHFDLAFALIDDPGGRPAVSRSLWVLLARDPALLQAPAIQARITPMEGYTSSIRLWTDDYSNLFQILK